MGMVVFFLEIEIILCLFGGCVVCVVVNRYGCCMWDDFYGYIYNGFNEVFVVFYFEVLFFDVVL